MPTGEPVRGSNVTHWSIGGIANFPSSRRSNVGDFGRGGGAGAGSGEAGVGVGPWPLIVDTVSVRLCRFRKRHRLPGQPGTRESATAPASRSCTSFPGEDLASILTELPGCRDVAVEGLLDKEPTACPSRFPNLCPALPTARLLTPQVVPERQPCLAGADH